MILSLMFSFFQPLLGDSRESHYIYICTKTKPKRSEVNLVTYITTHFVFAN